MTIEQYKKAHELQTAIGKLEYEINVIKGYLELEKQPTIRFGDNFNVSIPFQIESAKRFITLFNDEIKHKQEIVDNLKEQFSKI